MSSAHSLQNSDHVLTITEMIINSSENWPGLRDTLNTEMILYQYNCIPTVISNRDNGKLSLVFWKGCPRRLTKNIRTDSRLKSLFHHIWSTDIRTKKRAFNLRLFDFYLRLILVRSGYLFQMYASTIRGKRPFSRSGRSSPDDGKWRDWLRNHCVTV